MMNGKEKTRMKKYEFPMISVVEMNETDLITTSTVKGAKGEYMAQDIWDL